MAISFFLFALAVFFIVSSTAFRLPFVVIEDGFVFPMSLFEFPDQFGNIPFNGKNNLTLEKGNHGFNAFFAIPLNETNLAHEIHIIPNSESPHTGLNEFQSLRVFSNAQIDFYWKDTELRYYDTSCNIHEVESHPNNVKIQFYTNGTAIYDDKNICDMPLQFNYTHGNYFYIPFTISWTYTNQSFTLKMGNGIKLAFYQGQYEDPPIEKEWPLLELLTTIPSTTTSSSPSTASTTKTKIPTTSSPHSDPEFNFSIFLQQNYDLLIIIAILCFLILFCSMAAIFLCCCLKSK